MKKIFTLSVIVSMFFVGCASFEENVATETQTNHLLHAGFADATRTYVENDKHIRWHEDDRLTAFYGNTLNRQYKFNGKTGDNSGTFSLVPSGELGTGNAFDCIYALYPHSETATISEEGVISLTLPAVQSYAENSFGNGANTMIAVTENLEDTFLAFKNTCGYLKLKLYNAEGATIKTIEVKGNNGEKIAGAATATIKFGEAPIVTMADDATDTVMLDCGEGVALGTTAETATEFWFVLPETTFTKGITIVAIDNLGGTYTKSTSNEVVIERNCIQPMSVLSSVFEGRQQNNQIWYTSSDGEIVTPNKTDVFGVNIVSNEYKDGKGIITFDGDVVEIGSASFASCKTLVTISLPETVTSIGSSAFSRCSSLRGVVTQNGIKTIKGYAFQECSSLTDIIIPNTVKTIGISAFYKCESIAKIEIPDGVNIIEENTFRYCANLTNISIGSGVYSVGIYAFANSGLEGLVVPNNVITIKRNAFYCCKNLKNITLPSGGTTIGESAFSDCTSLVDLVIPQSCVTDILPSTFANCSSLKSVVIGIGVENIGEDAFYNCPKLTVVDLPKTISTIDKRALAGCKSLKAIYCRAISRPKIYYPGGTGTMSDISIPKNSGMKIYVPSESYDSYITSNGYGGLVEINWGQYKSYIEPYDFE